MELEYFLFVKNKTEFQKLLNQWKHQFEFKILWITVKTTNYQTSRNIDEYHVLIKRWKKCPHGTFGGWESCMTCRPELYNKQEQTTEQLIKDSNFLIDALKNSIINENKEEPK